MKSDRSAKANSVQLIAHDSETSILADDNSCEDEFETESSDEYALLSSAGSSFDSSNDSDDGKISVESSPWQIFAFRQYLPSKSDN